ncbi:MAG: hypothetical protein IJ782_02140 [Prevotella sp.]|nr:hypothetical protein [Prevotella sp.]
MRQQDINRLRRAQEHIEAAMTHLNNIPVKKMDGKEQLQEIFMVYYLLDSQKDKIEKMLEAEMNKKR